MRNNILHLLKNDMAGEEWYKGFIKRYPQISLRIPQQITTAKAKAFDKRIVANFSFCYETLQ
jgi:hypothetical protein